MRTLAAYQFDRNCVLAATAGQVLAALNLDCPIKAIVYGQVAVDVGIVAREIKLVDPAADGQTALIAACGAVALNMAGGQPPTDMMGFGAPVLSAAVTVAMTMVTPWVEDGRMKVLVRTLDRWSIPGDLTELEWLGQFKDEQHAQRMEQAKGRSG